MVAEGYRCSVCGGEVVLVPQEPAVAVGGPRAESVQDDGSGRRFERD
jgi:hypothetical protein